ncbi:uncharacterized protein BX663DRAFT_489559 [Cokeromyces recurvatus]|uniref:uncharacterized protein n=1 Tax=Cokeromyces recurvatus TaxID=90255 RepID=UPI002220A343|nr:uncharacterized protein BX663DRAFT_489559 [Cokeromyces recurvatus]KAI7898993.1 hypothetical protein BX663DRAFT_489559 [Cokeromyces recurvatus]
MSDADDLYYDLYHPLFENVIAGDVRYDHLNTDTQNYIRHTTAAVVYMSVCLACTIWQIKAAIILAYKARKWLHFAVVFEALLSFSSILCSILNSLTSISCGFRFWVSIVAVNLGGCCIQTILLYKAYICYDRSKWLIILGSFINIGYIALIFIYATLGRVPTYKDIVGNCVMRNLEWPALAKLALDIASNVFLSFAFLMVIHRHYRVFGNSLHKSLLSNGLIFSVGVIASNIITAILISCRVMGGLSADLYSFDWVITSYLLIKQFKMNKRQESKGNKGQESCDEDDEDEEEDDDDIEISRIKKASIISFNPPEKPSQSPVSFNGATLVTNSTSMTLPKHIIPKEVDIEKFLDKNMDIATAALKNRFSTDVMSTVTTVYPSSDFSQIICQNCLSQLPKFDFQYHNKN